MNLNFQKSKHKREKGQTINIKTDSFEILEQKKKV